MPQQTSVAVDVSFMLMARTCSTNAPVQSNASPKDQPAAAPTPACGPCQLQLTPAWRIR